MSRHQAVVKLTIPNGGTDSPTLSAALGSASAAKVALGSAINVSIAGPAALTGVASLQVSPDGALWTTMQKPDGTDVNCAAGKTIPVDVVAGVDLKIHSTLAEAAARDFYVVIQEQGAY